MNRPAFLLFSAAFLTVVCLCPGVTSGKGLYLDLPSYYQQADTSGTGLVISETLVNAAGFDASIIGLSIPFSFDSRTSGRVGILYPVIHLTGGYKHGFADGTLSFLTRVSGDSMNTSGIFLRGDIRVPIGSGSLKPFSFRSSDGGIYPDLGGGLEFRAENSMVKLRSAAVYTFSGQKDDTGELVTTDYSMLSGRIEFAISGKITFSGSVFVIDFDGPGYRECYLLGLRFEMSDQMEIIFSGGIDAGSEGDRVFDSLASVMFNLDFYPSR